MTPAEVAAKLQHFNDWRRGHHDEQPDPRVIGEAIDAAVEQMERQEPYCTAIGPGDWTYQISSPARPGSKLYALPGAQTQGE